MPLLPFGKICYNSCRFTYIIFKLDNILEISDQVVEYLATESILKLFKKMKYVYVMK